MQTAVKEVELKKDFRAQEISKNFLESAIGNTPLIRLRSVTRDLPTNIEIYAKAEFMNPGGSVKDRAALAMILAGESSGELTRGENYSRRDKRQYGNCLRDDRCGARL